jgi:hypothetical protein
MVLTASYTTHEIVEVLSIVRDSTLAVVLPQELMDDKDRDGARLLSRKRQCARGRGQKLIAQFAEARLTTPT